ncbi:MarR family transcriptional regulator [Nocardioides sp.]|uniref:MarR family transcriptional regulator n=1 Tax=Nocardioides sp. TaxID=35761 RepID=UPI0039E624AB
MSRQVEARELSAVIERLVRFVRELTLGTELSPTAAAVLSRLRRLGPQRLTELARAEGVSQPAMTQLVTRLERDRLVRRQASEGDRRGVEVAICDRGVELFDRRRSQRVAEIARLLDGLSAEDRAALAAALPALDRLLDSALD